MSSNNENQLQKIKEDVTKFNNKIPSLKATVKASVDTVNLLLSKLETNKHSIDAKIDSFASSRVRPLLGQVKRTLEKTLVLYQHRQYYGPQIIAGTAGSVGALVTLRRGKIPGMFTGAITGACAYAGIYGGPTVKPENKE